MINEIKMIFDDLGTINTLKKQLNSFFFIDKEDTALIDKYYYETINRIKNSFSRINNKYYNKIVGTDTAVVFDYLHQCQYSQFLYYLSNTIYKNESNQRICDKLYLLNKSISACDMFYEIRMPDIFFLEHPVGSVMGRATYSNYFCFCQGCTVGNNKGIYPSFSERVYMCSNSKVIGNCHIGKNVLISSNSYVKDTNIPSNSVVFGQSPNLIIKNNKELVDKYIKSVFKVE